jgi:hypothetical protein
MLEQSLGLGTFLLDLHKKFAFVIMVIVDKNALLNTRLKF